MLVVKKPFKWSPDGIKIEELEPGDRRDFGSAMAGLMSGGYIGDEMVADTAAISATDTEELGSAVVEPEISGDQEPIDPALAGDAGTAVVGPPVKPAAPVRSKSKR